MRVANDANCFAVSEAVDGAGAGAPVVFGVILGTGVGGGIAISGQALTGANAIAGEWGHNPLPWAGSDEQPGCGLLLRRARLHRDLSFRQRDHPRVPGADGSRGGRSGRGEPGRRPAMRRRGEVIAAYADRLARALASVINVLDPDVIVLGGGLSNIASLYDDVPRLLPRWVFSDRVTTRLRRNRHGDSSGVRGAAWLWPQQQARARGRAGRPVFSTRAEGEASR